MNDTPPIRLVRLQARRRDDTVEIHEFRSSEIIVGRSNRSDLRLQDANVARVHCRFYFGPDGELRIRDEGSSNGTFVNGRSTRDRPFGMGDELYLGDVRISLVESPRVLDPSTPP